MEGVMGVGKIFAVLVMLALAATASTLAQAAESRRIVTTTAQIADLVRTVTGDLADVRNLMGEGIDPHQYRPTRTDVALLAGADLVFWNGLTLEGQMVGLMERLGERKPVVAVGDRLAARGVLSDLAAVPVGEPVVDPHIWMDVRLWRAALGEIGETLATIDTAHAALYRANAAAGQARLADLHRYVSEVMASVPAGQRVLVTAHDAFNYFGRAYAIEVVGIQGISTESEAGLHRIEAVVDLLVRRAIPTVFIESSVSERNVQALIEGAGARGHRVRVGGMLYSDAMGGAGTYEGTYVGVIDHNATVIAQTLGGQAPIGGWGGRLMVAGQK